jgi:hypothetical protein
MKRVEVDVLFSPEAEREFGEIQSCEKPFVKEWARRYLEDLILFPPESWVDIHSCLESDVFKADRHIPFDIQGKIFHSKSHVIERVLITRFRLKRSV